MGRARAIEILKKFYREESVAFKALVDHGDAIAEKAGLLIARNPTLRIDAELVEEAAYLHDIGVSGTDAADIGCHGTSPYLQHGVIGKERLLSLGLIKHARIAERHIGVGLTREDVEKGELPLPCRDMVPETLEEQIVCFLDLFFSKTPGHMHREKSTETVRARLMRYGERQVDVFDDWCRRFKE